MFGEECSLPGNLVHRELLPDPPPGDVGDYGSWVRRALYEAYDEVRAKQQRATHRQKRINTFLWYVTRGTSIVVSTRAPSTLAPTDIR